MAKIAIDVVLLPSEKMMDKAIEINQGLLKTYENKIILDKQKCLPHISLCMGCIKEEDIIKINKILKDITSKFQKMNLISEKLEPTVIPTGKIISGIIIKNTKKLQSLHEIVMKKLWKFLSYDVKIPMLYNPLEVEKITLYWIKGYSKLYDNPSLFNPHITIGFGEANEFQFPIRFSASKIALCHLGNYCTCRKIIASYDLA